MSWTFADDLAAIDAALADDWASLSGARLFVTGGTGFIGRWLLEALRHANERHDLDLRATILTRDPAGFAARAPHLGSYRAFRLVAGDVLTLGHDGERYSHVIHAATDASAALTASAPLRMFDTIVAGTRRALDVAVAAGARRFLSLSSGAVYGPQPADQPHIGEDWRGGPDPTAPGNVYAEAKRAAEMLGAIYGRTGGLDVVTARIFAVLGPLLPLDIHFAAGNFIRDAMAGRSVCVEGAGQAVRSYLYAADLTAWLLAMLVRAPAGATYNVGSEDDVSIAELARRTATVLGGPGHEILGRSDTNWNPGRYVPSTARIRAALGVEARVGLDEAIRRTAIWNGWKE